MTPLLINNKRVSRLLFMLPALLFLHLSVTAVGHTKNNFVIFSTGVQATSTTSFTSAANPSCIGGSVLLTAMITPNIATGTVEFFDGVISLGIVAVSSGTATFNTSALSSGTHSLTAVYSGDLNYTTSTSAVLTQVVNTIAPTTPLSITGSAGPLCSGVTATYSIAAVTGATSYNWTFPAGWTVISGAGTTSINVIVGATAGNVGVSALNGCGNSAAQTKAVAVTVTPPVPGVITGTASTCPSITGLVFSIAAVPGATSYAWTFPTGWTQTPVSSSTSVTVTANATATSGNILVAAINAGCSSGASQTINLTPLNALDNSGFTDGSTKSTDGIQVATLITPVRRGYVKFPTSALSIIPGTATVSSTLKLAANASATNTGNFVNALGTNDPVTTPAATLFAAAASGANYSITNWNATGVSNNVLNAQGTSDIMASISSPGYIAMGLVRPGTGNSVANFWGYSAGANAPVLSITYANLRSTPITVLPGTTTAPGAITGATSVCPNSTNNIFSVALVTNATSYLWTLPAGWSIASGAGTNSITVTTNATAGSITVKAVNSCGTSGSSAPLAVTIGILPTVSATPATQEVCTGIGIGTITASNPNAVAGTTYNWTRDNTTNLSGIAANGSGAAITGTLTSSTTVQETTLFSIYAISGIGCQSATPAVISVKVNPNPIVNAGADQPGCAATAVTIGGSPTASGGSAGYTYLWTAGVSNTTIANPTAIPGTYTVTVTDAKGCVASDAVTVNNSTGTKTWIGSGTLTGAGPDNNFNNPLNWTPNGVPGACNDVVMNIDVSNIFNVFSSNLSVNLNAGATIKSLTLNIGGTIALSGSPVFKLNLNSYALNVLTFTNFRATASTFLATPARAYIAVDNNAILTYGGNLTSSSTNGNTVLPVYANTNNTGKIYINANADIGGIGSYGSNVPAQVIFDGSGTQTITNSAGTQVIYLGATTTGIGETNSPTVVLAGAGTNGFRNIGDLSINNTSTLDVGTTQSMNRNAAGGTMSMAANTFMKLGRGTGGTTNSNFPSNFSNFNFNATSTVDYNAAAGQNVYQVPTYGNLTISGSGTKTVLGNITAQKNITIQGGAAIFAGSSNTITLGGNWTNYAQGGFSEQTSMVDFNGTGAQTISTTGGEIFYSLRKTAGGTTTMLSDVAVQGGGTSSFTLSAGTFDAGTFSFNSASSSLNISNGLLKLARTGAALLPEFAIAGYNLTGGTIELYGAGDQVLRGARAYRNLTFSTSGIKTLSTGITSVTGTVLTQNSVTVDVSNNTLGGAGTNLSMTGTSLYKTAGTGTKPDAQGIYTLGAGTTIEFTNSLATTEDIRLTAPTYYNLVVSGTNVANNSAATGIKFQAGGTFTVKSTGLFKLANTAGFTGTTTTSVANTNNPAIVLENGSTVEYYGGPTGTNAQTITNIIPYYSLNFSGTSIKTAPATTVTVKGNLGNNNSGFLHGNGTFLLNGTLAQNYNSTGTPLGFYNFTVTNPASLIVNGDFDIINVLSLGTTGKLNLATGNIALRSTLTATASVDKITAVNSISYSSTGRFVVERFIPTGTAHAKSWQFLSTPAFGNSLNSSWQENNTPLANLLPGFGTTVSSEKAGAIARGYDFYTPAGGPSMKTYDVPTGNWVSVDDGTTPTSSLMMANQKGYMLFVRGDRSVQTSAAPANITVMRTRGKLYAPGTDAPPSSTVTAANFQSIGNPYASAVDFTNIRTASTGLDAVFYVWDPLLAGTYGYGAYQTFSSVNGWLPTPGGTTNYPTGVPNQKLQSGQAFFVYSTPGGTVNFNENSKIAGSQPVYRSGDLLSRQFFGVQLRSQSGLVVDGNTVAFSPAFSNELTADDAIKVLNATENFGIRNAGNTLAVDARSTIQRSDTVFYHAANLMAQNYSLLFQPVNMASLPLTAVIVDRYTGTQQELGLMDSTSVHFTVTNDAGSFAADRFYVLFKTAAVVPVKIVKLTATRQEDKAVRVEWQTENEANIAAYQLLKSADGTSFNQISSLSPASQGSSHVYKYIDTKAFDGENFYRVKAINLDGSFSYSNIVQLMGEQTSPGISVYPNPVVDKKLQLYFTGQPAGIYKLSMLSKTGQVVYQGAITVSGNRFHKGLNLPRTLGSGDYRLSITAPDGNTSFQQFIIL